MNKLNLFWKTLLYTFIFIGIFNSALAKILEFNQDDKSISNYFSGIISFDNFDYKASQVFFKKMDKNGTKNEKYSSMHIQSLINLEKYQEAYKYSKKLEKMSQSNFDSNLFLGVYQFKSNNFVKAKNYFDRLKLANNRNLVPEILQNSLSSWSKISNTQNQDDLNLLNFQNPAFENLTIIQKTFGNCFLKLDNTETEFIKVLNNDKLNFSRYHFFVSNYFYNNNNEKYATNLISSASEKFPSNLLINQFKKVLIDKEVNKNIFNCNNSTHIIAELFYILANVLSSQEDYKLSNFYINIAKFLNPKFKSYNALLAENFNNLEKHNQAKKIYEQMYENGTVYKWYSAKQIALIMNKKEESNSSKFLHQVYKTLDVGISETFDLANFLKSNENYEEAINLYSKILLEIDQTNSLYPEVLERRGMAYERSDKWKLGEKDLIESLRVKPKEPYVMNYLAYSWIEKNQNIEEALQMLREANDLKKNNGYITDSLGWALFKTKNFSEAKKYLKIAIMLMPRDPVINDHFADCLWMNDNKIQARYYWNNALEFDADDKLKKKIKRKILFGLEDI